jgi:hypothetical protein
MWDEARPCRRQASAGLVSNEEPPSQLFLERSNPGAHSRLRQMEPFRCSAETAVGGNFQKGTCEVEVHEFISIILLTFSMKMNLPHLSGNATILPEIKLFT